MRVLATVVVVLGFSLTSVAAAPMFERSLAPPSALDGIRVGMPRAQLAKAMTAFTRDEAYRDAAQRERYLAPGDDGAKYYVLFANDVVARIGIEAPAAGLIAKLTKVWGTPLERTNLAREGVVSWRAAGLRVDVACREAACRLAYHRELGPGFFGSEVGGPGTLAKLPMGTPRARLPALYASGAEVPAGVEDVRVAIDLEQERVNGVRIVGLPPGAGDALSAAWGAPVTVDGAPTWFAPARGVRARYDAALGVVHIAEYMPLAALLGPGEQLALPVLGLTAQRLARVYPRFQPARNGGTIALPPTELATSPTLIGVTIDPRNGTVVHAALTVPFATAANKAAMLAVLEAKWGKAQEIERAGQKRLTFPRAKARVVVAIDDATATLVVELS